MAWNGMASYAEVVQHSTEKQKNNFAEISIEILI